MCGAMSSGAAKTSTATRVLASDIHPNTRSTCGTPLSVRSADYVLPGSTREYPQSALRLRADPLKHKAQRTTAEPQRRQLFVRSSADCRSVQVCPTAGRVGSGMGMRMGRPRCRRPPLRCARALQVACAVCCMRCRLYALYVVCAVCCRRYFGIFAPPPTALLIGCLRRRAFRREQKLKRIQVAVEEPAVRWVKLTARDATAACCAEMRRCTYARCSVPQLAVQLCCTHSGAERGRQSVLTCPKGYSLTLACSHCDANNRANRAVPKGFAARADLIQRRGAVRAVPPMRMCGNERNVAHC